MLGTGAVGQTLASRLLECGHDVVMGARDAANVRAAGWVADHPGGRAGTFADAAGHAEVLVNATAGVASLDALAAAGAPGTVDGKVLVDVANPLDFSAGMPPVLSVVNSDSLAEQIQRAYPAARVVKALNTINASVMVRPELVPGEHHTFVAGDDPEAKRVVTGLLTEFGWPAERVLDLGGIQAARGLEMYLPLWLSLMAAQNTATFNIRVVRA